MAEQRGSTLKRQTSPIQRRTFLKLGGGCAGECLRGLAAPAPLAERNAPLHPVLSGSSSRRGWIERTACLSSITCCAHRWLSADRAPLVLAVSRQRHRVSRDGGSESAHRWSGGLPVCREHCGHRGHDGRGRVFCMRRRSRRYRTTLLAGG